MDPLEITEDRLLSFIDSDSESPDERSNMFRRLPLMEDPHGLTCNNQDYTKSLLMTPDLVGTPDYSTVMILKEENRQSPHNVVDEKDFTSDDEVLGVDETEQYEKFPRTDIVWELDIAVIGKSSLYGQHVKKGGLKTPKQLIIHLYPLPSIISPDV